MFKLRIGKDEPDTIRTKKQARKYHNKEMTEMLRFDPKKVAEFSVKLLNAATDGKGGTALGADERRV